ncbi:MAG: S16 family serine protease [Nitriliruptoraceae bacterium]
MQSSRRRRRRWLRRAALALLVVLVLPVPWLHVVSEDPPGTAWRLNGRLQVDGEVIDPPGRWTWLAVGRPALVAEVLRDAVLPPDRPPIDLRTESATLSPALAEPAAAAVGLRHAGVDIPLGLLVEAYEPLVEGLPERAIITQLEGIALTDRDAWERASSDLLVLPEAAPGDAEVALGGQPELSFQTATAGTFVVEHDERGLPYRVVRTLDTAPPTLDARIAFAVTELLPVDWFRELSLGSSHGLMVALTTYAHVAQADLAAGRHLAGTGGIRGDGTVVAIGGLRAKAEAARRAGADVLFFPASQELILQGFEAGTMTLVPVTALADAIEWLTGPTA